jgi:hypothetical protein
MAGEIAASGTSRDEIFSREEGQGARVVVVREMDLGEPERIGVAVLRAR